MLNIGCHLSSSKGFYAMGETALEIGANTFQFFTRNPRGSKAKAIDEADVQRLLRLMETHSFAVILAHAPYTLNPCSADEKTRAFSLYVLEDDLARMEYLPHSLYNFHPGSHVGQGAKAGIEMITRLLNQLLKPEQTTTVLLETMSGKGTEVGRTFEEIRAILDGVTLKRHMGVCLDTCHIHDGGYDLVDDTDAVVEAFDRVIGLEYLRAIHLNDSMHARGSHKDRHARIGQGEIGLAALTKVINHPKLRHLPFYLETPNELPGYAEEIALLRSAYVE